MNKQTYIDTIKALSPIIRKTEQTTKSGIYLYERTDEKGISFFYCGQAKDIFSRQVSHWNGYEHIDISMRKRKFKSSKNPYGWTFKILEYCPFDKLDEREQYYIMKYLKEGRQTYNVGYGGQKSKDSQIREQKPNRGYLDGLKQGRKNAVREVKVFFDKYLDYSVKGGSNKIKERKYNEFKEWLKDEE